MDQKYLFGGLFGYGISCMDYFFANSKILRLYAILHDVAGSVKSTTHKGPGCYYALPRFPSFCFLGQVTGLFFCFILKFLLQQFMPCSIVSHINQKLQRKQ